MRNPDPYIRIWITTLVFSPGLKHENLLGKKGSDYDNRKDFYFNFSPSQNVIKLNLLASLLAETGKLEKNYFGIHIFFQELT